jgi:hypothetical protein
VANARLFAAAPELVEALKELYDASFCAYVSAGEIDRARAALEKAGVEL